MQVFPGNYVIEDPNNTEYDDDACTNQTSTFFSCWKKSDARAAIPKLNDTELGPQGCEENITEYAYTFFSQQNSRKSLLTFDFPAAVLPMRITIYYYCDESLSLKSLLSYNTSSTQIVSCTNRHYELLSCQQKTYVSACNWPNKLNSVELYMRLKAKFHLTEVHFFARSKGKDRYVCIKRNILQCIHMASSLTSI